ncbi:MAG: DUF5654 family protein [Patescibacteria group bacterium]|jgi:TRAP-type C4-dicarboxylate transport system permease small subunit
MTKEYLEKVIDLVTAAFGLVAALAWNSAIQELINAYYPAGDDLRGKFLYAIVITAIAVWATTSLARIHDKVIAKEAKAKEAKK